MSDDLISRKALIADMRSRKYIDKALCEIFETIVDDASIAFDKEKVINEIQVSSAGMVVNMNVSSSSSSSYAEGYIGAAKDIIEIVERGGIE